jgi:hypothetical protein
MQHVADRQHTAALSVLDIKAAQAITRAQEVLEQPQDVLC